jgi:hypothetical protein
VNAAIYVDGVPLVPTVPLLDGKPLTELQGEGNE